MAFFHSTEGKFHVGRFAGTLYVLALIPGMSEILAGNLLWLLRVVFAMGWLLSFSAKRVPHTLKELLTPLCVSGMILMVIGLVGQFVVTKQA